MPTALRKDRDSPTTHSESGFDLSHVESGKVFVLAFRQRRCLRARFLDYARNDKKSRGMAKL